MMRGAGGRVLAIADEWPWPADTGYRLRLEAVLSAMSQLCAVDLFSCPPTEPLHPVTPDRAMLSGEAIRVTAPWFPSTAQRFRRWRRIGQPWLVTARDWSAARTTLASLLHRPYDAVWLGHCSTLLGLGDLVEAPKIVDLDDMQSAVSAGRLRAWRPSWGLTASLRCLVDVADRRRWSRVEQRLGELARDIVVCSDLDQRRLAGIMARVVPNGYAVPRVLRATSVRRPGPPVVTMVATMGYEPNLDGALWFADHVLPRLTAGLPGLRFQLVGSTGGRREIRTLAHRYNVDVVGHVGNVSPYLQRSSVVVAPIRFGGGTRIKILEGFAHRIPVVSTSAGCEGLDVVHREHLMIADTPQGFANACRDVVTEPSLAARLVDEAYRLVCARYESAIVRQAVAEVVAPLVGRSASRERGRHSRAYSASY